MQASKAGLVVNEKQLSHLKPEDYKQCKEDCKKMMANEAKKHALPEPDGAVKKVTKKEEKKEEDKEKLSITPTLNK